jgi:hypothetical protein
MGNGLKLTVLGCLSIREGMIKGRDEGEDKVDTMDYVLVVLKRMIILH